MSEIGWEAAIAKPVLVPLAIGMDWHRIAPNFEHDGSLRDIYILDATLADWASAWDILQNGTHPLVFEIDGEAVMPPTDINDVFELRERHSVCAKYTLGKQQLNCHFFMKDEIEFDLDPKDVDGPDEAYRLAQFMATLGRTVSKDARLTPENEPQAIIARYEMASDCVIWTLATI